MPAAGMKKPLHKAMLPHNITSVCCMTKVMVCRKTMSAPAIGLRKPLHKDWRLRNMVLVSFTTVGRA